MKTIFKKIISELNKGNDTVFSFISRMNGSAPRGVGACMLVNSSGLIEGTVGGGIAENNAIKKSVDLIEKKESGLSDYLLYPNEEANIGSVCGGEISIFFQYIDSSNPWWIGFCESVIDNLDKRVSSKILFFNDQRMPILSKIDMHMKNDEDATELMLPIEEKAYVFGAGHCAKALVPILKSVDFNVTVMDDRKELINENNFPDADLLVCEDFSKIDELFDIGKDDFVVIMTAGHRDDYLIEHMLLPKDPAYIGVIGSRSKIAFVNEKLEKDGIKAELIKKVHTPIGLDIKSITPSEVAVSICAEMILERARYRQSLGINIEKDCLG